MVTCCQFTASEWLACWQHHQYSALCVHRSQPYLRRIMKLPRRKSCCSWQRSSVPRWLTWYSTWDTCSETVLTAESSSSLRWVVPCICFNDHVPGKPLVCWLPLSCHHWHVPDPCIILGLSEIFVLWEGICRDKPVGFYGPIAPPVRNAPQLQSLHAAVPPVQSEYPAERSAAAAVP